MWILMWTVLLYGGHGYDGVSVAVGSQEFNSAKQCLEAKRIIDQSSATEKVTACVKK